MPRPLAQASGPATFVTEIHASPRLTSVPTGDANALGEPAQVGCDTCHDVVDVGARAKLTTDLQDFHQGLEFSHGALACTSCHAEEQPTRLHLATGEQLALSDALTLCSQCHGPQRRSYERNAHGGISGHWDLSRGPRLKNHCVDCHDPHLPAIGQVLPVLHPKDRGHFVERSH